MNKIKTCVIFGGVSTEHDVSIVSGTSVISHLDKEKYDILPIYIDKSGFWYKYTKEINKIKMLKLGENITEKEAILNIIETIKNVDVVLPIMHGIGGEDGSIQGLLEFFKIPYIGSKILGSSIGLDKVYAKTIWKQAGIKQAKYLYIIYENNNYIYVDEKFNESKMELKDICKKIKNTISYPMFVKPSNLGSSVGISKVNNLNELVYAIEYASKFDKKILVEEGVDARELECAVLGNCDIYASTVGEIIPAEEFYSFHSKYQNTASKTKIPANIGNEIIEKIQKIAIKAYKAIDAKGLARVDFFLEKETNEIYINEINTMPGFTEISMYPKLWEASGLNYTKLLDKLIELAIK